MLRRSFDEPTRQYVIKRDVDLCRINKVPFSCPFCRFVFNGTDDPNIEVDHVVPKSIGGSGDVSNLHVTCFSCNRSKSNSMYPKGLLGSRTLSVTRVALCASCERRIYMPARWFMQDRMYMCAFCDPAAGNFGSYYRQRMKGYYNASEIYSRTIVPRVARHNKWYHPAVEDHRPSRMG